MNLNHSGVQIFSLYQLHMWLYEDCHIQFSHINVDHIDLVATLLHGLETSTSLIFPTSPVVDN